MTELDTIRAAAEAARNAIDTARSAVLGAIDEANSKAEQVASLGLEGVAHTVMAAHSSLAAAASSLDGAHDAAESAGNTLGRITNPAKITETVEHLGAAGGQFDQADSEIDAASGSVQEAHTYAQQAEIESVIAVTGAVLDHLSTARQATQEVRASSTAYRGQIEAVAGN